MVIIMLGIQENDVGERGVLRVDNIGTKEEGAEKQEQGGKINGSNSASNTR